MDIMFELLLLIDVGYTLRGLTMFPYQLIISNKKTKIIITIITTKYVTLYMKMDIHVDNSCLSWKMIFVINYWLPFLYHIKMLLCERNFRN